MALPLKSGADLYNQQAIRMRLHNLGADPSEVGMGLIYFNTNTDTQGSNHSLHPCVYNGTSFKALAYVDDVANNAEFKALQDDVKLLKGDVDTDTLINNLKDLEEFLKGYDESDKLQSLLDGKFDKSGGTISGGLTIGDASNTSWLPISFNRNGIQSFIGSAGSVMEMGTNDGYLRVGGNVLTYMTSAGGNALLHSGNIGEYSALSYGIVGANYASGNWLGYTYATDEHGGVYAGGVISCGVDTAGFQLNGDANGTGLAFRGRSKGTWLPWKTIAFTDSDITGNAASASKIVDDNYNYIFHYGDSAVYLNYGSLSTRSTKIYGKTIDFISGASAVNAMLINSSGNVTIGDSDLAGTSNKLLVDGRIVVRGNMGVYQMNESNEFLTYIGYSASNSYTHLYNFKGNNSIALYDDTRIVLSGGNVLIGTTNDDNSGAKLQVKGSAKFYSGSSDLELYSRILASGIQVGRTTSKYTGGYNGGLQVGEDGTNVGYIAGVYDDKDSSTRKFFYGGTAHDSASIVINGLGGKVLIGIKNDNGSGAKLQVSGGIYTQYMYDNDNGYVIGKRGVLIDGSQAGAYIGTYGKNPITFHIDSTEAMRIAPNNDVTINGDLHVTGNIIADKEVSAGGASEEGGSSSGGSGAFDTTTLTKGQSSYNVAHNLGTDNVIICIYEKSTSGTWEMILTDVEITDANNIKVTFGSATSVDHKVVIMGAVA